jgi:hypothetical protein
MSDNNTVYNCGCCKDTALLTPEDISNFPGLSALHYRVGTHYSFKHSMLNSIAKYPALNGLTSRYNDDFAAATLDSWATVLDVLSFYQERIINEGFLRTATERLSVMHLAKHISYRLKPGVAAGTFLAFSMNEALGAPASAIIPVRTKVQSVPEQNQLPQVFETTEQIEAQIAWNSIRLQTAIKFIPQFGDRTIYVKGITTNLQPGDGLLMIGDERAADAMNENWDFRKVKEVWPDRDLDITKITWSKGIGEDLNGFKINPAAKNFRIFALRQKASLFGYNAPEFKMLSDTVKEQFLPFALIGQYYRGISFDHFVFSRLDSNIDFDWKDGTQDPSIGVDQFSVRWTGPLLAPVSGPVTFYTSSDDGVRLWVNDQLIIDNWTVHGPTENSGLIPLYAGQVCRIKLEFFENTGTALIRLLWSGPGLPKQVVPPNSFVVSNQNDWPNYSINAISQAADTIHLDALYQKIVKDSWLVLSTGGYDEVYKAAVVSESSRKDFTLTAKTTAIKLSGENLLAKFNTHIRDTIIYAQSEELEIAKKPFHDAIQNDQTVSLAELIPGLHEDQYITVTGKRMRFQIMEEAGNPLFSVDGNSVATRHLSAGDTLIVLRKAEDIAPVKQRWTLEDSGGFTGSIDVDKGAYRLIPANKNDANVSELHTIKSIAAGTDTTVIILTDLITNYFDTTTVAINANVAAATQGETKEETLGSGDPAHPFQKFVLKQKPLTYVSDGGASGAKTTLWVRVNDVLWKEVTSFYGASPKDKVYTTDIADDGKVTVQFGDGITGARLPGGTGNVTATYRVGIGSDGLLHAAQLSMLMTPQLGVNKVVNPMNTSGAADPETIDKARENAPFTVLTLDRIVSIKDFENFARAFAGIGKACAEVLWNGEQQEIYITVAGTDGRAVDENSGLHKNLSLAIQTSGHTYSVIGIHSYTPVTFSVDAGIQVNADYLFEKVKPQVIGALKQQFSFQRRDFGQDVTLAEIMAIIQGVEGVIYVDINRLNGHDPFTSGGAQRIVSNLAVRHGSNIIPAQLITISEININPIL